MNMQSRFFRDLRCVSVMTLCAAVISAGCARPPKPKIDNLYRGLNEDLPRLDPRLLTGRRIVVDPGHGGHFPGTRGQDGLDESAVNLGVALYLWGLLREAGAEVYLTRSAEKDLLSGADSTVAADLQVRVDMVESVQPDIVVSIHHNAEPRRDPAKNAVETYYKIGDPASRDLAFAVHRHLARNLGIDEGEVRSGNYFVLRGVRAPAILGEGSYLTHPGVETKLRLSEKQRLEAEAYFLGILEYFSRGTPAITPLTPSDDDSVFADIPILAYSVTDVGGMGIDPGGLDLVVNGASVPAVLDPSGTTVFHRFPWDSPNGVYDVALTVRNLLGNSSRACEKTILLDLPPEHAVFHTYPESIPSDGGAMLVRARLLDRRGLSIADGRSVSVRRWYRSSAEGKWSALSGTAGSAVEETHVRNGVVELVVDLPSGTKALRVKLEARGSSAVDAPGMEGTEEPASPPGVIEFEHVLQETRQTAAVPRSLIVLDRASSEPVDGVRFVAPGERVVAESRDGRFVLDDGSESEEIRVHAPGYRPGVLFSSVTDGAASSDTLFLDPWYEGKLGGSRIVVNPEGDAGPASIRGRLGLSGSNVSLQVARYLREYLEAAGARVALGRVSEETPLATDVVALTNRFKADAYIEIRYRKELSDTAASIRTYYFPGSARGLALAGTLGEALAKAIGAPASAPADIVTYPLQQTACPAIIVEPPSIGVIDEELRLSEPWYQRIQAYGIFCGILRHRGVEDTAALQVVLRPDSMLGDDRAMLSNWLVAVDGTWRLLTGPDGKACFRCLTAGIHRVELSRRDRRLGPMEIVIDGVDGKLSVTVPALR